MRTKKLARTPARILAQTLAPVLVLVQLPAPTLSDALEVNVVDRRDKWPTFTNARPKRHTPRKLSSRVAP
jgi:hypothetical protein